MADTKLDSKRKEVLKTLKGGRKCEAKVSAGTDTMLSIHTDKKLREALYALYVSQFKVLKKYPVAFTNADATRMLTSLMGSRPWSWKVIGITEAALEAFAENDFKRPTGKIQRGHREDRASTAQALFSQRSMPAAIDEFFEFFLKRDQTVLMTAEENKHRPGGKFPKYIPINADKGLFPCGTLVGWRHRKAEIEFLRSLFTKRMKS